MLTGQWIQSSVILSKDILNSKRNVGVSARNKPKTHRKLELFTDHQYIKSMMLFTHYTPYILFYSISLEQIGHVHYLIWLSPIPIRKEGGGGSGLPFSGKTTSGLGF